MVKSSKKKVRTNSKTRKNTNKVKEPKGGGVSYEQSQLVQIRGKCDKYNELSVGKLVLLDVNALLKIIQRVHLIFLQICLFVTQVKD